MASASALELLLEACALKALPRTGWVRAGIPAPESVAGHSWGLAWLVLLLLPPELDRGRALAYAALHDLPEVRTGDRTPADAVPASLKRSTERDAMRGLLRDSNPELIALFEAYAEQRDAESRYVHQLDRLDMAVQGVVYRRQHGVDVTEFLDSAAEGITAPELRELLEGLRSLHDAVSP